MAAGIKYPVLEKMRIAFRKGEKRHEKIYL